MSAITANMLSTQISFFNTNLLVVICYLLFGDWVFGSWFWCII